MPLHRRPLYSWEAKQAADSQKGLLSELGRGRRGRQSIIILIGLIGSTQYVLRETRGRGDTLDAVAVVGC